MKAELVRLEKVSDIPRVSAFNTDEHTKKMIKIT